MTKKRRKTAGSLSNRAYVSIRDGILRGLFPMGTSLSRRKLAAQLGMSPLPISEALRQLESEGLVESRPRVGTRVRVPTPQDLRDRYIIREALECQSARLFAEKASAAERSELHHGGALGRHDGTLQQWRRRSQRHFPYPGLSHGLSHANGRMHGQPYPTRCHRKKPGLGFQLALRCSRACPPASTMASEPDGCGRRTRSRSRRGCDASAYPPRAGRDSSCHHLPVRRALRAHEAVKGLSTHQAEEDIGSLPPCLRSFRSICRCGTFFSRR